MPPHNWVYGLSGQGRAVQARGYSRTYGFAAAARDERQGRSGGEKKHGEQAAGQWASGRADELTGDQQCSRHSS